MSVLSSLFKRLGVEGAEPAFRSIALDIFRTPATARRLLLDRAIRDAALSGLDEASVRGTWERIFDAFDNVAATNPEPFSSLQTGSRRFPGSSRPTGEVLAEQAIAPTEAKLAISRLPEPGGPPTGGLQLPLAGFPPGPTGISATTSPLDFLLSRVEDDLLRGAPSGLHPRFLTTLRSLRRARSGPGPSDPTPGVRVPLETRILQTVPFAPTQQELRTGTGIQRIVGEQVIAVEPSASALSEASLAHKRDQLHSALTGFLHNRFVEDPSIPERFAPLRGISSDIGDQVSTIMNEVGRIFTAPLPASGQGVFDKVLTLAQQIATNLGITDPKRLRRIEASASASAENLRLLTPNVGASVAVKLEPRIELLSAEAASLRAAGGVEAARRASRIERQIAALEKASESAVVSAGRESVIDTRVRFADAIIEELTTPLLDRDQRAIKRLTQFILFERGDIRGSAPRLQLPAIFADLFSRQGIQTEADALKAAARQTVASGLRAASEVGPVTSPTFREFFTGSGSTQIREAPASLLKSAPSPGAIVRFRSDRPKTFEGAARDLSRATGEDIPVHIRNADELVIIEIVEARAHTGRVSSPEQAASELTEKLAAAKAAGKPKKEIRALEAQAFQARIASRQAAQSRKETIGEQRIFPAAIVSPLDRPDLPFAVELKQLEAVRPPNPDSRKLALNARSTIASFTSPSQVFDDASRVAGVGIITAGGEPAAYNIRRPGFSMVEFTADPSVAASAQLEPGVVIERITGATPYQAAAEAAKRALQANKELLISARVRSLADELGQTSRGGFALADLILSGQEGRSLLEREASAEAMRFLERSARANVTDTADIIVTQMLRDIVPRMHLARPFRAGAQRFFAPTLSLSEADAILRRNVKRLARHYNIRPQTAEFRIGSFGDGNIDPSRFTAARGARERIRKLVEEAEAPIFYIVGDNVEGIPTVAVIDMTAEGRVGLLRDPQLEATQAAYAKLESTGKQALKGLCSTEEL